MRNHSHHNRGHHEKLNAKWVVPVFIGSAILVLACSLLFVALQQRQMDVKSSNQVNVKAGYREVMYNGRKYRYNNQIRTILFAGLDSEGEMVTYVGYTGAPRADSIVMMVLDGYNHKMTLIGLSRDTMTEIHRFALNGKDLGSFRDHLCYAFTYGNGGEVSCKNLCEAVSNMFYGIPVHDYLVINRSAIQGLSDLIGPVQVVVPNQDLEDAGYREGETVTIDTSNIELFIRKRDTQIDFSNAGRMERQRAYINGALSSVRAMVRDDASSLWDKIIQFEKYIQTSITRSQYLDLTRLLNNSRYSEADYYIPEGENVTTVRYDEFYPDEEKLREKVIELFYQEM